MSHTTTPAMEILARPLASEPGERGVRPRWVWPALLVLLVGTALLYLWGLPASGTANDFYAAAVQAGTKSWKAFLFGSFDSANFITVDKPPASLWIMELSGRIFGFSSGSMLAPQALEGVAAVGLLYAAVRRWFGPVAGLAAGATLALTPVAVLMFRFNNPDALLTLLMVAGAYATTRAIERPRLRWVLLAGVAVGFAFLTKTLEAFLVVPAFALAYLFAAPIGPGRRVLHLLAGLGALVASAGWWVLTVQLWPASARPYIGGSTDNSVLGVAFGYNGLGRITGDEGGGPGGGTRGSGGALPAAGETLPGRGAGAFPGGGNPGFGGVSGPGRLFGDSMGTQISWLLPAALIGLVAGLWLTRRAPRTDRTRAALVLFGGWLLVTGLVFSYMRGIIHPYYTVALAPPIAALVAVGGRELWRHRAGWFGRIGLVAMVAATGLWGQALLRRTPNWYPALRYVLIAVTVLALLALLVPVRRLRRAVAVGGLAAVLVGVLGTGGYALDTAATAHSGSIPTAGPDSAMGGGPGGVGGMPGVGRTGQGRLGEDPAGAGPGAGVGAGGGVGSGTPDDDGLPGMPDGDPPAGGTGSGGADSRVGGDSMGGGFTGGGGPQAASTVDPALVTLLRGTTSRWAAATEGSQSASPLELATGKAVMAMGGFSGSDPAPSLAQFQDYVSRGEIHYYVGGGMGGGGMGGGGMGGGRGGNEISTWVGQHFTAKTVGGATVYDLTKPTS